MAAPFGIVSSRFCEAEQSTRPVNRRRPASPRKRPKLPYGRGRAYHRPQEVDMTQFIQMALLGSVVFCISFAWLVASGRKVNY